jgi:hypothetical protein
MIKKALPLLILIQLLFLTQSIYSQTNPTAQNLPYSQNFGGTAFSTLPGGMAAWTVNGSPIGTQSSAETSTTNGNAGITGTSVIQTTGGVFGYATSLNGRVYIQTSSNTTNGTSQLALAINTTSKANIKISYDIEMISALPKTVGKELQYRVGTSGAWINVSGSVYSHNSTSRSNGQIDHFTNLTLPVAAENQPVVQLRWITWRGPEFGNSSGLAVDNISITSGLSLSVNSATICLGSSTSLTATGATLYTWSPAIGLNTTIGASVIASPATTTVYTVTGRHGFLMTTATSTVTVNALPTVTSLPGLQSVCSGAAVLAENFTSSPAGATFAWTNNNTTIGLAASGTGNIAGYTAPVVATQHIGVISVTGTLNGCSSASPTTFNITINPKPTMTALPGVQSVCGGALVSAENFTSSPAGATFAWTNNNTTIGLAASGSGNIAGYTAPSVTTQQIGTISVMPTLNGCSAASPTTFNITIKPKPTVTSLPGLQSVCSGAAVLAENFTSSPAGATFAWTNNNTTIGLAASGTGNIAGYTAPVVATQHIGVISVTGTLNGCSSASPTTFNITINPKPTMTALPGVQSVCGGALVSAENFTSSPAGATFAWTNNNTTIGLAASGSGNIAGYTAPSVTTQQIGTISVMPTLNGCSAASPTTFNITIKPKPTVSITPTSTIICSGSAITLTAVGATSYLWSGGSATTNTLLVSPTINTTYTVTGTIGGCINSATAVVTVSPNPAVSITPTSTIICLGGSTTLTAGGATSYVWSSNAGSVNTNSVGLTPTATDTYTVTGTTGVCVTTATAVITINPSSFTIAVTPNTSTICLGSDVFLTASGATSYTWAPLGGLALSSPNYDYAQAFPSVSTVYTVTSSDGSGCIATTTVSINVNSVSLNVTPSTSVICLGGSVSFMASGSVVSYNWSPTTYLSNPTIANPSASPLVTTNYVVYGTDANGCTANQMVTVTVNPSLVANAGSDIAVIGGQPAVLNGGPLGAVSYVWNPGNLSGQMQNISPTTTTTYTLSITDSYNCTSSDQVTISVVDSYYYAELKKKLNNGFYQLYNNKLYFKFEAEYNGDGTSTFPLNCKVYNTNRQIQSLSQTLNRKFGDNRYQLDMSSLSNGYYVLEVLNEKNELFQLRFKK